MSTESVLPPGFEQREDGAIVVSGHRITLFAILEAITPAVGARELHDRFPTLTYWACRNILSWCRNNRESIKGYHEEQRSKSADIERHFPSKGTFLDELRERYSKRQEANENQLGVAQ